MIRRATIGALLIGAAVISAFVFVMTEEPVTCEAWKAEWNLLADRFDGTYTEFAEYVRSEPAPGLDGARPIYAYAQIMEGMIAEAGELPDPPSNLQNAREYGLESLRMVSAGVRSIGEGVESGDQERVEWGARLITQGRSLVTGAAAAAECTDPTDGA